MAHEKKAASASRTTVEVGAPPLSSPLVAVRHTVQLSMLPAGYVVDITEPGKADVCVSNFLTSRDGDAFYSILEGVPSEVLHGLFPNQFGIESTVNNLLAVIHRDRKAEVYLNLNWVATVRSTKDLAPGSEVFLDDILEVDDIRLPSVPNDCGVIALFSLGWHRGVFFDFRQIAAPPGGVLLDRDYSLSRTIAAYYSTIMFRDALKIDEAGLAALRDQGWFPFRALGTDLIKRMHHDAMAGADVFAKHRDAIVAKLLGATEEFLRVAADSAVMKDHFAVFTEAVENYRDGKYISAIHTAIPRIEGLMRSMDTALGLNTGKSQSDLANSATVGRPAQADTFCPLLPHAFRTYLRQHYFANFGSGHRPSVGRNAVGHGVAPVEMLDPKNATIALLVLLQYYYVVLHAIPAASAPPKAPSGP